MAERIQQNEASARREGCNRNVMLFSFGYLMYLSFERFGIFPSYICICIQVLHFLICATCIDIKLGRFKTTGGAV